jgi:hypothetical protein
VPETQGIAVNPRQSARPGPEEAALELAEPATLLSGGSGVLTGQSLTVAQVWRFFGATVAAAVIVLAGHLDVLDHRGTPRPSASDEERGLRFVGFTTKLGGLLFDIGIDAWRAGRAIARRQ